MRMNSPQSLGPSIRPNAIRSRDGYPRNSEILPLLKGKTLKRGPLFWHYPHYGNQGGVPTLTGNGQPNYMGEH